MGLSKYHSATTESILRVSNATVASVQVYISRKFPLFASKSSFRSQLHRVSFQRARGGRRKKEKGKKERKREKRERDSLLRFLLAHASSCCWHHCSSSFVIWSLWLVEHLKKQEKDDKHVFLACNAVFAINKSVTKTLTKCNWAEHSIEFLSK